MVNVTGDTTFTSSVRKTCSEKRVPVNDDPLLRTGTSQGADHVWCRVTVSLGFHWKGGTRTLSPLSRGRDPGVRTPTTTEKRHDTRRGRGTGIFVGSGESPNAPEGGAQTKRGRRKHMVDEAGGEKVGTRTLPDRGVGRVCVDLKKSGVLSLSTTVFLFLCHRENISEN